MAKQARDYRVPIMMTAEELAEIDNWRFARHIATRSDAIRRAARNGLGVESDVADIAERTEILYDEIYDKYLEVREWVSWLTDTRPSVPPPPLTAEEVLDKVSWWLQGMVDIAETLDIQALALNNRLVGVAVAPHDRASRLARRRAMAEADKRRADYEARAKEFEDRFARDWVLENMSDEERKLIDDMSDDEADAYIQQRIARAPKLNPFERSWLPETIYSQRRKAAQRALTEKPRQLSAGDAEKAMTDYQPDSEEDGA